MPFGLSAREHGSIMERDRLARWALKRKQAKPEPLNVHDFNDAVRGFYGR